MTIQKAFKTFVYLMPAAALFAAFIRFSPFYVNLLEVYLLLTALLGAAALRRGRPFAGARLYVLFYAVMLLYASVSLLWVKDASISFNNTLFYQLLGVAILILTAAGVEDFKDFGRLLDVLSICLAAVVLCGIAEIYTGFYVFSPTNPELHLRNVYGRLFPYGPFNNTNDYSTFVTLFMPFVVYHVAGRIRGFWGGLAAAVTAAAALFTLFNADPRVCYIALVFMAAAFFACAGFKRNARSYAKRLLAVAAAGAGILGALFFVLKTTAVAQELMTINTANHSVSERLMLTVAALRMLAGSCLMGVGTGNSTQLVPYYSASIRPLNLHNMTLQILTEYGIIIFALYILFMAGLFFAFLKLDTGSFRLDMLACVCFSTLVGYPVAGIASSDTTRLFSVWLLPGLWLAALKIFRRQTAGNRPEGKRLLFISFVDLDKPQSGSSVRPRKMYEAFLSFGYEVELLSGLQNRRRERRRNIRRTFWKIRKNLPDFCYVEPPSGPVFNLCDHLLLIWLRLRGVPIGLFYRDAYWRFAPWWPYRGLKRFFLVKMQQFDLFVFQRVCRVVFFPTQSMAELFPLRGPRRSLLPPAGEERDAAPHGIAHRAVYVGGVSRRYGTDLLLAAFELLNEKMNLPVKLMLVCREDSSPFFDGYRGREWLSILHASGQALEAIYQGCDIALFTGRRDEYMDFCMPVKLFEYISYGLPVVSTDCYETAKFISENGIGLVAECSAESIAENVARLYRAPEQMNVLRARCLMTIKSGNLWRHRAMRAADEIMSGSAAVPSGR